MFHLFLIVICYLQQISSQSTGLSIYDLAIKSIKCDCSRSSDLNVSELKVRVNNCETGDVETFTIDEAANSTLNISQNQCINIFIPGFNTPVSSNLAQSAECIFCQIQCNGKHTISIIIDHYYYTKGSDIVVQNTALYKHAVKFTKSIGIAIGKFINELLNNVDRENINVIGHSIGAHMAGYAADYIKDETGTELNIIYGADAAGPCFHDCPSEHLQKGQAKMVHSFHTTEVLGTNLNIADYDFISNDGKSQKGCAPDVVVGMSGQKCSHFKAVPITLNPAVTPGIWKAYKCSDYDDFQNGTICANNENTLVGYTVNLTGTPGVYFFEPTKTLLCDVSN